jgi:hypothetical protein
MAGCILCRLRRNPTDNQFDSQRFVARPRWGVFRYDRATISSKTEIAFSAHGASGSQEPMHIKRERAARKLPSRRTFNREILDDAHVLCLQSLGAFDDAELHSLTFWEALEATRLNCGKVYEDIFAVLAADKAKSLCVVKPLHCSLFHDVSCSF